MGEQPSESIAVAKRNVKLLLESAVEKASQTDRPIEEFRGIALYDSRRDSQIAELPEFKAARDSIAVINLVQDRFGANEGARLTLQLVYSLFAQLDAPIWSEEVFESIWGSFLEEAHDPTWTYRGIANLRNFDADSLRFDLGDGIVIQGRDFSHLRSVGFSEGILQRLVDDWSSAWGSSSFVMTAESSVPKSPDSVVLSATSEGWMRAQRAIAALRLVAPGDIGLSQMWVIRPSRFNVGLGGVSAMGHSISSAGTAYTLTEDILERYGSVYERLHKLETMGYGGSPGNLDLAPCLHGDIRSLAGGSRYPTSGPHHGARSTSRFRNGDFLQAVVSGCESTWVDGCATRRTASAAKGLL